MAALLLETQTHGAALRARKEAIASRTDTLYQIMAIITSITYYPAI